MKETTRIIGKSAKQSFLLSEDVSYSIGELGEQQDIPREDVSSASGGGGDVTESTITGTICSDIGKGMLILLAIGVVVMIGYFLWEWYDSST